MKTPKRVKGYVNVYPNTTGLVWSTATKAKMNSTPRRLRTARLVELRRGEVIVDVEALCQHFWETHSGPYHDIEQLRAALRKVGKR